MFFTISFLNPSSAISADALNHILASVSYFHTRIKYITGSSKSISGDTHISDEKVIGDVYHIFLTLQN